MHSVPSVVKTKNLGDLRNLFRALCVNNFLIHAKTKNIFKEFDAKKRISRAVTESRQMVPQERETLNSLFTELADWEEQLKHIDFIEEFEEPQP